MDFLGVGVTSNYNQSNSWAPRIRQAFFEYDNTEWGFHFLAGQAWSMLTQNKVGITARQENIPLTIDPNYVVGFDFTRNWQLRVVKDFGSWAAFGLSIENPAELVYNSTGAVANGGNVGGWLVNYANAGNSFLGSGGYANNFATDVAPDIIGKAAFDPGWGHYEVFGIARFFNDNTFGCLVAPLTTAAGPAARPRPKPPAYVPRSLPTPSSPASRARGPRAAKASAVRCCCPSFPSTSTSRPRPCTAAASAATAPRICPMSSSRPMVPCRRSKRSMHWAGLSCTLGPGWTSTLMPDWKRNSPTIGASSPPAPFKRIGEFHRLRCSERDQHRMQHYHRGLVHRRHLELRGHQQVGERCHRGLLAGFLQRQLRSGRRRVRMGIHPPLCVSRV